MSSKSQIARSYLCAFLLTLVAVALADAGPPVIGLVAGSTNASVGGEAILPNTTLFSGDSLQVNDGVAVVALGSTSRMIFGRDTVASFRRDSDEMTVFLHQGDVTLLHAENTMPVRVKVGDVSVVPVAGIKTLGKVVVGNEEVMVTAKDGRLRVEGNGQAINVAKGETVTVAARTNAPQAAGESGVPKPPFLPLQSTSHPSPMQIRETAPGGGSSSTSPIRPSHESGAKADASGAALDAVVAVRSTPVMAPATTDTIGRALNTLADDTPKPSPHKPY